MAHHWIADGKYIFAYASSGGAWCSEIAEIFNRRSVNQMLQYSNLGENAEEICDRLLAGSISNDRAIELLKAYNELTIKLTDGTLPTPPTNIERQMLVTAMIEIDKLNNKIRDLESLLEIAVDKTNSL